MSVRKGSRRYAIRDSAPAQSPKRRKLTKSAALDDPIEYLFELMNDERLSRMQRVAIAKRIAPYYHPKLKRVPATSAPVISTSSDVEDPTEDEAEMIAERPERIRRFDGLRRERSDAPDIDDQYQRQN